MKLVVGAVLWVLIKPEGGKHLLEVECLSMRLKLGSACPDMRHYEACLQKLVEVNSKYSHLKLPDGRPRFTGLKRTNREVLGRLTLGGKKSAIDPARDKIGMQLHVVEPSVGFRSRFDFGETI